MEIAWLQDFVALSDTGNFSRAAVQRNLTQPAFSRRIRSLEAWLGVSLFDRSTHPASLTEAGRRFLPLAEDILSRVIQARDEARAVDKAAASTLRFAATHVLSLTFFPKWLRSLESRIQIGPIHLTSDSLQRCEDEMLQGRCHFLLCHDHSEVASRLHSSDFLSVRVGEDVLVPVVAAELGGKAGTLRPDGGHLPILAYSPESGLGRIVRILQPGVFQEKQIEPVFTSHLAAVLKTMVLEGRGIAWLPNSLIRGELDNRQLVEVGGDEHRISVDICLFRRSAREPLLAESFWDVVQSVREGTEGGRHASAAAALVK